MNQKLKDYLFSFFKLFLATLISIIFLVAIYFILKETGIIGKFNNVQELKKIILSSGFFSYFIFSLIQFLQVVILPIPSMITTAVGIIIFGAFNTLLISFLSILLGSLVAYFIGKIIGIRLLNWSFGKSKTITLQKKLNKGKYVFFIMMLLPFFPDDMLCFFAGATNMNFKFFLLTNIITRLIGLICFCFLGNSLFQF